MKKLYSLLAVVLFASMIASCSNDSSSSNNNNNNNNPTTPKDTMIVTVDGTTYRWPANGTSSFGAIRITGIDGTTGQNVTVALTNVSDPGTYSTASQTTLIGLTYGDGGANNYGANLGMGTGTVTLTQTSPNFIGTFSGTLIASGSASGSVTITNGSFNVVIP